MRMDQVQPEIPEEKLLAEAGLTPPGLPGFLCGSPRFPLADMPHPVRLRSTHAQSLSVGASTGTAHVYPPVTQDARAGSSPTGHRGPEARRCPGSWPPACGTPASPSTCSCPAARPPPANSTDGTPPANSTDGTPAARTDGRRNPGQFTVATTSRIRCRISGPKYTQ